MPQLLRLAICALALITMSHSVMAAPPKKKTQANVAKKQPAAEKCEKCKTDAKSCAKCKDAAKCEKCKSGEKCDKCKADAKSCTKCKDAAKCEKCKSGEKCEKCEKCKSGEKCDKCKADARPCAKCKDAAKCEKCKSGEKCDKCKTDAKPCAKCKDAAKCEKCKSGEKCDKCKADAKCNRCQTSKKRGTGPDAGPYCAVYTYTCDGGITDIRIAYGTHPTSRTQAESNAKASGDSDCGGSSFPYPPGSSPISFPCVTIAPPGQVWHVDVDVTFGADPSVIMKRTATHQVALVAIDEAIKLAMKSVSDRGKGSDAKTIRLKITKTLR